MDVKIVYPVSENELNQNALKGMGESSNFFIKFEEFLVQTKIQVTRKGIYNLMFELKI